MNARIYLAELLGTFLFMLIGYSSVAAIGVSGAGTPGVLVVPFSFGFGLLAAIFAFGHISGAHYNPAVTIAIALDRRLPAVDAVGYIIAQVIGASAAAAVFLVTVSQAAVAAGITKPGHGITDVSALVIETVFTADLHRRHPVLDQAGAGARPAGDPADARRDPLRDRDAQRLVGQPGPLDRLGAHRRRPERALDLPPRAGRRRHHRLGHLPRRRRRGGRAGGLTGAR